MRRVAAVLAMLFVLAAAAASAAAAEREVLVLRGRGSPPPAAVRESPPPLRLLAGQRLWLVDSEQRRLVACRLERTTRVGERRIRCAEGGLPGGRG